VTELRYANPAFRKLDQKLRERNDAQWTSSLSLLTCSGMAAALQGCLSEGRMRVYAARFYYAPSISVELSWLMRPVLDTSGNVVGVMLTLGEESIDFGRRHLARVQDSVANLSARILQLSQEKQQSDLFLRVLHRDAPIPMLILNSSQQVIQANHQAEIMFGRWGGSLIGMSCTQLMECQYTSNCPHQQISTFSSAPERIVIRRPDGSSIVAERSIARTDGVQGVLLIEAFIDITQREQAETDLKKALAQLASERELLSYRVEERTHELSLINAELRLAARAKDEFLAAMSHELRTPLTAILGMTEMLTEGHWGPVADEQREYLSIIHKSGSHLLDLINDILDIAKAEAGALSLLLDDEVYLAEVCEASLRLIGPQAKKKHMTPEFKMDPAVSIIRADKKRLKQILVNLLSNAVKFTPDGGRFGLEVRADIAAGRVYLEVWDTGIGIDEENQSKLFKPFFQVDSKLSRQYEGTGLGLALVARMVALHGGEVSLQSLPERGSRFLVCLPWDQMHQQFVAQHSTRRNEVRDDSDLLVEELSPQVGARATGSSLAGACGQLILLVEDEPVNQMVMEDFLVSQGYQVSCAGNGEQGIKMAAELKPDLILMDVQMPVMDGLEATRRLKSDPALSGTPVVMLTALAMTGDKEICLAAGANGYLSKPVELKKLAETVAGFMGKQ
jgi:PAS domain S-box-containing protein